MNIAGVEVSTLDLVFGVVLLISAVVGLWRGLVYEVLSLAGWVAAYIAAQLFSSGLAPSLPVGTPGSALNLAAAFALVFFIALIVWSLLAKLMRYLIHATPLSAVDRLFGVFFGLARGVLLLLVVATLVAMTPARDGSAWRHSQIAQGLHAMLQGLRPLLPAGVAQHLPA